MNVRAIGAWSTAGVALWASLGVLDVVDTAAGVVRVAMLPSPILLPAAVALALLAGWVVRPRTTRPTDAVVPLYALWLLVLPYLPWLPDWLPVLRVLAGPARYLVWMIVAAQVIWSALGAGRGRHLAARVRDWSDARAFAALVIGLTAAYGLSAAVVSRSSMFPGGDEPHYLVIAQSLLTDGDLDIENNHERRDYRAYFPADLQPHALARGTDGKLYSVHPVGLPVLIAPAFAAGGYTAVVALMLLLASVAAALSWLWVRRLTGSVSAATFACAAAALSVSYAFSAGTVYPEIAAALAVMLVFGVGLSSAATSGRSLLDAPTMPRSLVIACAAGALPWLSSKYALISVVLIAIAARRILQGSEDARTRTRRLALLAAPYTASVAGWLGFFYLTWGSPSPSAAYGGMQQAQMSLSNVLRGVPGLLFDQEYGLLSYAPVLALAAAGWWHQWREGGPSRWLAVEVAAAFGTLLLTVAGHTMWWGGTSVPARFLVSGVLLLALPVAWEYRRVAGSPDRRALYRLLLLLGLAASVAVLLSPEGSVLANRRNGISRLLEWLSPDWHLWAYLPDFIAQPPQWALTVTLLWLVSLAGMPWVVSRVFGRSPDGSASRLGRGLTFLRASAGMAAATLLITVLVPLVLGTNLKADVRLENRGRVAMLESFDPHARPLAIRFDPVRLFEAGAVPPMFELTARPGTRRSVQPVPLLLNARFALPAGRYRVVLTPASDGGPRPLAGTVRVQAGRNGGTLASWQVATAPGIGWSETLSLPVDLSFVGFHASRELAANVGELRLVPVDVVPDLDRTAANEVLSSVTLSGRFVFLFHDGACYPEPSGFWVRGEAEAMMSVVAPEGRLTEPVTLRLRNGPFPNVVRIASPEHTQEIALGPFETREVSLTPLPLDGTLRLGIRPQRGFVPARVEPGNKDGRVLGCWVEVVG